MTKQIKDTTDEERSNICIENTPLECCECPLYVDETRCCRDSLDGLSDEILNREVKII